MISRSDRLMRRQNAVKGWAVTGNLTAGTDDAVSLQANFKYVGYYTIQFSMEQPDIEFETGGIFALADITWTVAGNPITRRVSIVNGMTISGMGESVYVEMYDFSQPDASAVYKVACSVARGARPVAGNIPNLSINTESLKTEAARRGESVGSILLPGASRTWDVPVGAGVNSVFIGVAPVDYTANSYTSLRDALVGFWELTTQTGIAWDNMNRWIPLMPASARINIALNAAYVGATGVWVAPLWGVEG